MEPVEDEAGLLAQNRGKRRHPQLPHGSRIHQLPGPEFLALRIDDPREQRWKESRTCRIQDYTGRLGDVHAPGPLRYLCSQVTRIIVLVRPGTRRAPELLEEPVLASERHAGQDLEE